MDSFTAWEIVRYILFAIVFYYFAKAVVWVISDFLHWIKTGKDGWGFFRSLTRLAVYIGMVLLFFKVAPTVIEVAKEEYNQIFYPSENGESSQRVSSTNIKEPVTNESTTKTEEAAIIQNASIFLKAAFENDYQTASPYLYLSDGIDEHTAIESLNAINQLISLQEDMLSKSKGILVVVQFHEIESVEQVDANHARVTYTTKTSITSP